MRYDSVLLHICMYLEHIYNSVIQVCVEFPLTLFILVSARQGGVEVWRAILEPTQQSL